MQNCPQLTVRMFQPESDGSRSGSSLSLRNMAGSGTATGTTTTNAQSPSHRGVHRSISATNAKPSRRASSGGETLRESTQPANGGAHSPSPLSLFPSCSPPGLVLQRSLCFNVFLMPGGFIFPWHKPFCTNLGRSKKWKGPCKISYSTTNLMTVMLLLQWIESQEF